MYTFIQKFHSGWAYLVLFLLFVAAFNALLGFFMKREFVPRDRRISLVALIAVHLQLVIGLVLYLVSPVGKAGLGEIKNAAIRLTALEHPLINLIAIALVTIGWSRHKKLASSEAKFKAINFFYAAGLVLILLRIPGYWWGN